MGTISHTLALDPVRDTQAIFRATLEALARPGRVVQLPTLARGAPGNAWAAALLIALLDGEVSLCVSGIDDVAAVEHFVVQRTSARLTTVDDADFVLADAATLGASVFERARKGSLEFPDDSATLVLQTRLLTHGNDLTLVGPGIEAQIGFGFGGPDNSGWVEERVRLERLYPRGIDTLLVDPGGRLIGLPRSTHIERSEVA